MRTRRPARPGSWIAWLLASLITIAVLGAVAVRGATPAPIDTDLRPLAFAAPDEAVAGQRVTAFGAIDLGTENVAWHQVVICPSSGSDCVRNAPRQIAVPDARGPWIGRAGYLSFREPGVYRVRWSVFVDAGLDTPWKVATVDARVHVVEDGVDDP